MLRLVVPLEPETDRSDVPVRNRAIAENPVDSDVAGQFAYSTFVQAVDVEDRKTRLISSQQECKRSDRIPSAIEVLLCCQETGKRLRSAVDRKLA